MKATTNAAATERNVTAESATAQLKAVYMFFEKGIFFLLCIDYLALVDRILPSGTRAMKFRLRQSSLPLGHKYMKQTFFVNTYACYIVSLVLSVVNFPPERNTVDNEFRMPSN